MKYVPEQAWKYNAVFGQINVNYIVWVGRSEVIVPAR